MLQPLHSSNLQRSSTASKYEEQNYLQMLESVMDNINDAILITEAGLLDLPGPRTIYVNAAFTRMTGYDPHEVIGQNPRILQGPDTDRATLDKLKVALKNWQPVEVELLNYRKDGSPFWVEISITPLINAEGRCTHWISVQRETTNRRQDETIRRESEKLYRTLAKNLPNGVVALFDRELRFTIVEGTALEKFGFTNDMLEGKTPQEAFPADLHLTLEDNYREALAGQSSKINADFGGRQFVLHFSPVANESGEIYAGMVLVQDVHELLSAQSLLSKQNEVLELLASGVSLSRVLERLTLNIEAQLNHEIFCSVLLVETRESDKVPILRTSAAPNLPVVYSQAIDGLEVGPQTGSCGSAAYLGQTVIVTDTFTDPLWENYREIAKEFNLRSCWSTPIKSQTGRVLGTFGVYTNKISTPSEEEIRVVEIATHMARLAIERKQAEEALDGEKQRLAVTLQSIGDGVITTDSFGRVLLLNTVAEQLTGWTQIEAAGRPIEEVFAINRASNGAPLPNPVRQVLQTGQRVESLSPCYLTARDGRHLLLAKNAAPITPASGQPSGVVLIFRDISEQQKMEQELSRAHKLESVGILAGGIAHDFNNLLTAIVGNLSLARFDVTPGTELEEMLEAAERASFRARDLTQQLLTFAKGGAPVKKVMTLPELIKESAEFALHGTRVHASFDLEDDLCPVEVDGGQLGQVIQNLVLNAVQAMPEGGRVTLRANNVSLDKSEVGALEAGRYVKMSVIDEGTGISPEHLASIFDPYFTTKPKGHGLGLATAYSIIKHHEGLLTVESAPGHGTSFYIYLPASARPAPLSEDSPALLEPVRPGARVLVMEDDPAIRQVLGGMLQQLGYQAEVTANSATALARYERAHHGQQPFDMVILDLTIPGETGGVATLRALQKLNPAVKAIVSSGYSTDPIMAHYQEYGFAGVVTKPYKLSELAQVLREVG